MICLPCINPSWNSKRPPGTAVPTNTPILGNMLMKGIFIASFDFETKRMASFGPYLLFMAQLKMI
jgi:hypothetical protein